MDLVTDEKAAEDAASAERPYPSKPRFDDSPGGPIMEVGFTRSESDLVPPEPTPEPTPEPAAIMQVEATAIMPVPPPRPPEVLPLEIDYSKYTPRDYPRIDPNVNLRSVQADAVDAFFEEQKLRRTIIAIPTGAGKTVAGMTIAGRINGRVLWIAHRDELIEQPAAEIDKRFPGLEYGIEKGGVRTGVGKRVVIASIQTLSKLNRLKPVMSGAPFALVVYDECLPGDETVITTSGHMRMDDPGLVGTSVLAWSIRDKTPVFRRVLRHVIRSQRNVFLVSTRSGRTIRCTENELFLSDGVWKRLSDLTMGDAILTVDTGRALAAVEKKSSYNDRATAMASGTAGRRSPDSPLATGKHLACPQGQKDCAHAAAEYGSRTASIGSSKITSDKTTASGLLALPLTCVDVSTERSLATRASVPPYRVRESRSRTDWFKNSGRDTRCPDSSPFNGDSERSRTKGSESALSEAVRLDGQNSWKSETSSSQTDQHAISGSPENGLISLMRPVERGGTWTTEQTTTVRASSIPKDSLAKSVKSSLHGYATSDSSLASTEHARVEVTERRTSKSVCEQSRQDDGAQSSSGSPVTQCCTSSDEIVSVEPDGFDVVYDIEVEEDHNFITSSGFVVHNCHHAVSKMAQRVLAQLGCLRKDNKGPLLLGLTATVERSDKTSLGEVFDDVVYSVSMSEAIALGYLVPPKPIKVYLPINPKALKIVNGDFAIGDLERELARTNAAQATATAILANCQARKTIAFCASVNQAQRTADACVELGLKAAWVSGEPYMNKTDRRTKLHQFSIGEIQVLTSSELLTEGYDERSITAVVIARPTKSQGRYCQMVGRGLRTCEHKVDCLLIDIVGASDLGLVTAEFIIKPDKKKELKKRPKRDPSPDSSVEWQKLAAYLRSASVDLIEHGELSFARASVDMIVTVAKDRELVILRRVATDPEDLWQIEHRGVVFSPMPLTLQETMSVCDTLMDEFGGGAKPGSPEWDVATSAPAPPKGFNPVEDAKAEATRIVQPESRLPIAFAKAAGDGTKTQGLTAEDLAERIDNDMLNSEAASFAKGIRMAFKDRKIHLLDVDRGPPHEPHRWGWAPLSRPLVFKTDIPFEPEGAMIGWVRGDAAYIDAETCVPLAKTYLMSVGEPCDIRITHLRRHLGTKKVLFKGEEKHWLRIRARDIDPLAGDPEASRKKTDFIAACRKNVEQNKKWKPTDSVLLFTERVLGVREDQEEPQGEDET